jgi:hypothetical protein
LKLAFWPALAWSLIEYPRRRGGARSFWSAKGYALLVAPFSIVVLFYAYTTVLGHNVLALDIATFIVAVTLGQLASSALLREGITNLRVRSVGMVLLACQIAAFSTLTYFPPPLALFTDSRNGVRGIPPATLPGVDRDHPLSRHSWLCKGH